MPISIELMKVLSEHVSYVALVWRNPSIRVPLKSILKFQNRKTMFKGFLLLYATQEDDSAKHRWFIQLKITQVIQAIY